VRTYLLLSTALAAAPALAFAQAPDAPKPAAKPAAQPAGKAPAKPAEHTVGAVVVTGETPTLQTSIDRRSYDVGKDLQAQSGSISDALRNVPSVEVDVQGNISLRGDPNVTILVDGKPSGQFQGDNKAQSLQALPASQIERVEVITNPSAEFRAEGTGGIINLITKKAKGAGKTGSVKASVANRWRRVASVTGGYNSPKLSLSGGLDYRHDEQRQDNFEDRFRADPAGGFDEIRQTGSLELPIDITNARGSLDYDLDAKTHLGLETHGAYIDFHLLGPSRFTSFNPAGGLTSDFLRDLDIRQRRAAGEVSGTVRRKLDNKGQEVTASLSYETLNDDRVRSGHAHSFAPLLSDSFDRQNLDYDTRHTELKADYVKPLGPGSTFKAGMDLEGYDNSYRNLGFRGTTLAALAPDASLTNLFLFKEKLSQAYVTYEKPLGDITVLAGLRVEDARIDLNQATQGRTDKNYYTKIFPSLHLAWKLDDEQTLTASYSHRLQRPDPQAFNTFRFLLDPINLQAGNAHLKPQETHSYELGYEYRASPTVYLATLYYRDNFNGFAPVVQDIGGGVFLNTLENVAKSRSAGVELVANGRLGKTVTYNLSSNLYWTELGPQPLGSPETRSAFGATGRGNLSWQATPKDLFQLNAFLNGKRLTPQGSLEPFGAVNLGYRRKVTDQFALVVTAQDLFHTIRLRQVIDTPILKSRQRSDIDSRQLYVGFLWTYGGGRQRDPGFDFGGGGVGPPQ
jgi:outer membrane receptor protein involved in Fe transport